MSRHRETHIVDAMLQAGASGYVLKQSASRELANAVRIVADGGQHVDAAVAYSRARSWPEPLNETDSVHVAEREDGAVCLEIDPSVASPKFICIRPARHPDCHPNAQARWGPRLWLRCFSLKYSRYSRSSRLASRAPRRPRCDNELRRRDTSV